MTDNSMELEEFVRETLSQIDKGLGEHYTLSDDISFEVAVIKTVDTGGQLHIRVVDAGRKVHSEETSKVKFEAKRSHDSHPAYERQRQQVRVISRQAKEGYFIN